MICLYHGTGVIGSAIRWQTRGPYSHAAYMRRDGTAVEAWHLGGVMQSASPFALHGEDAQMDLYMVPGLTYRQQDAIEDFLSEQVGCKYDWLGVVRFLSGVNRDNPERWFCSELVAEAHEVGGRPLLRAPAWKLSPSTLAWSTDLRLVARNYSPAVWEVDFRRPAIPRGRAEGWGPWAEGISFA